ncbi:type IV pilus biogenesis protein PilM [Achromobacter seleniivolatilans]|uniref:Type IV pilus biogenesis protein PilM n=1 Tax=Achromobacter seleniivolatilans TaxID=3047478 RepID=A0ABY9LYA7_9BURK|nr:type IV pilus biogenesis protein PilM [Achromobacter sp. R39]WMD19670.1 type IV pilus biogenesis protein PilM [Achromobacter sp. R39]
MGLLIIPLLALLSLIAVLASHSEQSTLDVQQHVEAAAAGGSLRIYAGAVARFAQANPNFSGAAPYGALGLPTWFYPQPGTDNLVIAGKAYVYFVPSASTPDLYRMIPEDEVGLPYLLGIARNGYLDSPSAGTGIVGLPAPIPEGAVVYIL